MKTLKVLLILCSLLISVSLFADDDYEKEHYKYEKNHFYKNLDFLDLNQEQYKKIRDILVDCKRDYQAFYEYKLIKKKELRNIMQRDIFDSDEYIKINTEIKLKASQLEAIKFKNIHQILNKKQRIKFSYFLQEWELD